MGRPGAGGSRPSSSSGGSRSSGGGGGSHKIGSSSSNSRPTNRPGMGSSSSARRSSPPPSFGRGPSGPPPRGPSGPPPNPFGRGGFPPPPPPPPRSYGRRSSTVIINNGGGGYYSSPRRRSSSATTVFAIMLFIIAMAVIFNGLQGMRRNVSVSSSYAREKLTDVPGYRNNNITDELGWFDNASRVSSRLQDFYSATGVQPYVILRAYDSAYNNDTLQEEWTRDYYENNIDVDSGFLIVYFEEEDPDEIGNCVYWYGARTSAVMDAEAINIFFNYLDNYWYTDMSMDDVIVETFNSTSKTIMQRSKTSKDITWMILAIVLVVASGAMFIISVRVKRKAEKEKAEETERILSQPLPKTSTGSAETDAIADKYK